MLFRRLVVISMIGFTALALAACGSDSDGESAASSAAAAPAQDDSVGSVIVRTGDTFDVDSFVAAGFKKSKEFSTETIPEASSIWYGFYSQRDVEIRFYGSHEEALGTGAESARAAVDRSPNSNIGGGIITSEQFAIALECVAASDGGGLNTHLRRPGESEGWGMGAAAGAKLAAPDTPVIGLVGDGSVYYS
ncbi:MAG: hypothetical protein IIA50_04170, partial [Bacteroidetes bacterium]|nr:hypothetical protein [Bacteroidota bacterium]